jgi:hypothetical protein
VNKSVCLLLFGCFSLFIFTRSSRAEPSHTSFFNSQWLRAVVSIDVPTPKDQQKYQHIGTGFLLHSSRSHMILVTAKHVVADAAMRKLLVYRVALDTGTAIIRESELGGSGLGDWFLSSSSDVACRFIGFHESTAPSVIPADAFLPQGDLEPGAPLLVLGFPYGEPKAGATRAIVRRGVFAGTDDNGNLIADAFVFPGNSGGPVIYSPPVRLGANLQSTLVNDEKLVGLVVTYTALPAPTIAYVETVVYENSGLAGLVPAAAIQQLVASKEVDSFDAALSAR